MLAYIIRRLLLIIPTLFGIMVINFAIVQVAPGGPVEQLIAELEGSDPGHLWIPTKPGRTRGGVPAPKPGITPAAVRTLHASHRALVSQLLGTPLRPGALRAAAQPAVVPAPSGRAAG